MMTVKRARVNTSGFFFAILALDYLIHGLYGAHFLLI
jgi:hypothetical protein